MQTPTLHPDVDVLRTSCRALRAALQSVTEEWYRLSTQERPRIVHAYDRYFGDLEKEQQRLALDFAELQRRVELLTVKAARGERLTPAVVDYIDMVVDREYARYRKRMGDLFDRTTAEREAEAQATADVPDDRELVTMYRTLVKRLHPDARPAGAESDPTLWERVQQAYQARNVSQLRSLLVLAGAQPGADEGDAALGIEALRKEEARLAGRLRVEQRKLDRLRAEEPFSIATDIDDAYWRERHRRTLEDAIAQRRAAIVEHRQHYRDLTGREPGGPAAETLQESQTFDRDFMEHTYFGTR